ncbi:acid stress chaperone HdeB [Ancylobacter aquaticus]|uniref:Acid stress chaperone HdeB n=1 Tax=Ancylobacter aquaticus TaxID=100 RepID=A0A4R1I4D2_ANCAQ|nr:HdeA/HdeB family chaperone [Ancylobacter aquaticus]TCK28863.1 acid stress chaperone HdeB [Ancylobacter aquaticus]
MRKLVRALVLASTAVAWLPHAALADKIDLSTTTCAQFLESDKTEIMLTLAWLDAYYKDVDAPPVIDTDKFVDNAGKLGDYCAANPSIGLITATDELFGD